MNSYGSQMAELNPTGGEEAYLEPVLGAQLTFGEYVALPSARTLKRDGAAVCIGARAFDLLVLLLAARGTIIRKEEIMRRVWPYTTVDESNLRFQMASLRKVLGKERERIKTITGRGYLFATDAAGTTRTTIAPPFAGERGATAAKRKPAIVIIDENPESRDALQRLLRPFDADVQSFVSVEAFVASGSSRAAQEIAA